MTKFFIENKIFMLNLLLLLGLVGGALILQGLYSEKLEREHQPDENSINLLQNQTGQTPDASATIYQTSSTTTQTPHVTTDTGTNVQNQTPSKVIPSNEVKIPTRRIIREDDD